MRKFVFCQRIVYSCKYNKFFEGYCQGFCKYLLKFTQINLRCSGISQSETETRGILTCYVCFFFQYCDSVIKRPLCMLMGRRVHPPFHKFQHYQRSGRVRKCQSKILLLTFQIVNVKKKTVQPVSKYDVCAVSSEYTNYFYFSWSLNVLFCRK